MEAKQEKKAIILELTKEESIVLLDWLARFNESENNDLFQDQAEERVLWDMEASLERIASAPFQSNYDEILSKARAIVRD